MRIYICTYIYIYTHINVYTYTDTYMRVKINIYMLYMCIYTYVYIFIHIHMYWVSVSVSVSVSISISVSVSFSISVNRAGSAAEHYGDVLWGVAHASTSVSFYCRQQVTALGGFESEHLAAGDSAGRLYSFNLLPGSHV